jgi:serine/threonine protein kinase
MLDPHDPRFRPEVRVIRSPTWRAGPQGPELLLEKKGEWRPVHPIFIASIEALLMGGTFEDAVERALVVAGEIKENHVRIFLRRHFWQLRNEGYLDIALEAPPAVFHDRYTRLKELGRGGMGIAHLCRDETTGREVVVKHAWGWLQPIDRTDRRMRAEADALAAFDHAGIPRIIERFERGGLLHVAREYVDGAPLSSRVARDGALDAATRRRYVLDAGRLVLHMHERGYLFLDPTPGNFLLRADGSLAVIDVGICRPHEDGVAPLQSQVGSRGFASPEAIERHDIGVWSDVFALGALHLYLATGKTPPHAPTAEERAATLEKLDLPDAEREALAAAWQPDFRARPPLAAYLRALEAIA